MAEDQKAELKENSNANIRKYFESLQLPKIEDKYDILIQYDNNAKLLSLNLTNQMTKSVFKHDFDKEAIAKVTSKSQMKPERLVKLLIDTLSSTDSINKYVRVFILPNIKQGINIICSALL